MSPCYPARTFSTALSRHASIKRPALPPADANALHDTSPWREANFSSHEALVVGIERPMIDVAIAHEGRSMMPAIAYEGRPMPAMGQEGSSMMPTPTAKPVVVVVKPVAVPRVTTMPGTRIGCRRQHTHGDSCGQHQRGFHQPRTHVRSLSRFLCRPCLQKFEKALLFQALMTIFSERRFRFLRLVDRIRLRWNDRVERDLLLAMAAAALSPTQELR
jgi:hypothetical protein